MRELIRQAFPDAPIMEKVAWCESTLLQRKPNGELVRGLVTPADVGVFQVNEDYHLATSRQLGINIHTIEGNIAYARYLYDRNGLSDWSASKYCWSNPHLALR